MERKDLMTDKKSSNAEKIRTSLYLRKDILRGLQLVAVKNNISVSQIVERVMEAFLETQDIPEKVKEWMS